MGAVTLGTGLGDVGLDSVPQHTLNGMNGLEGKQELAGGKRQRNRAGGNVFGDFLDTRVRNGIGHNSARYDAVDDAVIPVKSKAGELKTDKINYTEFCRKVVSMVSRLFVVETYLNAAVRAVGCHLDGGANS